MKNKKMFLGLLSLVFITMSCSNDDSSENNTNENLKIVAKTTYSGSGLKRMNNNSVTVTEFKVNIREIEFEIDDESYDDDYQDGFYGDDDNIELQGPFELDLTTGISNITSLNVPNLVYEEIEFKIAKNTNPNSDMFNKSVVLKGTISDIPFEFWHNIDEDLEVDYNDASNDIIVSNNLTTIALNFNLDGILSQVDLSTATDGNGDGLIEINPTNVDGNQLLANTIKSKIKDYIDLLDD